MDSDWALDPRMLAFPITKPPPTRWEDVSCVHGRCSRHWGLIRGLIEEQKKARKNRGSSSARLTATLFREVVARLSLSLEAVDTKDKFSCTPGVGEMVTARNPKHQPSNKTFVASAAAILVAMRFPEFSPDTPTGEVENFAWCSMAYLTNHNKFDCVAKKDLDEKATVAQLQELGERPICSSPGCNAYATKRMGDLSERVKPATFLRSVYCDEHYTEMGGGGGKRKKAAGKDKGKSGKACDPMALDELDLSPLESDRNAAGSAHDPPPSPPKGGKIKAGWYRRLLGEALLKVELHRVEKWKGPDVANGLTALWRKEFVKNAKTIYSLTPNGEWMATRLERAIGEGPGSGASSGNVNATTFDLAPLQWWDGAVCRVFAGPGYVSEGMNQKLAIILSFAGEGGDRGVGAKCISLETWSLLLGRGPLSDWGMHIRSSDCPKTCSNCHAVVKSRAEAHQYQESYGNFVFCTWRGGGGGRPWSDRRKPVRPSDPKKTRSDCDRSLPPYSCHRPVNITDDKDNDNDRYASCSERDGGGGGGTAASTRNGHSPLAPTRANGAAKPGVRLLIDNREKRGVTSNSQISHLTNYLNSRGVPYEVREWKIGDYGWVVQPDAGKPPAAGEVGYEREFVVPRLLERKRVDDLAESMKDGRLVRQKKAMLRAKSEGVAAEVEVHVEGDTADGRFVDEIYRRGLTPEDLDEALRQAETQGFKVVRHNDFASFSAYLADATQSLQIQFEARSLDFESFFTWQNLIRFSKGQVPVTPTSAAAAAAAGKAAAAAKAARGGRRGRPPTSAVAGGCGRPPLASRPACGGLRQRTLDGAFGVARRGEDIARGSGKAEGDCAAVGDARVREESAESRAPKAASTWEGAIDIDGSPDPGAASDSSDGCSVVEVVVRPIDGGGGSASGSSAGSGSGSTSGSKGKSAPAAAAGTSSSSTAGGGVSSAAAASSVRRTSPITLSPSEPGRSATSSRSVLHGGEGAEDSPLPTTLARGGGGQSGSVGRNSSSRRKRPRPADEGSRDGDGASSPLQYWAQGIKSGDGREWGGVEGTRIKKARSLSFVCDDEDDDQKGGGGRGGDSDLRQANSSGSASGSGGGGKGSGSSLGSLPPAASRSVDDGGGGGGGGVVDLSLDSPSPPVPPRSRPRTAVSPPRPTSSSGGAVSGGAGTDGIVLEACSSDDEFAL
ncbi:unnamed protein product [Ectocarpus sp. CCAP 1310/34]|nr:unnamed protein product [Ectocarpus sp. CCAP 1310/34]